jgi:hypothetical protein
MTRYVRSWALAALAAFALAGAATPSLAEIISQTAQFRTSFSAFADSSTQQTLSFDNSGVASAQMNPFNASLGTLDKVNINWDIGLSFSGTTGSSGGSAGTSSFGGNEYVNTINYSNTGTGTGGGGGPNSSVSFSTTNQTYGHYEFLLANAGGTYDAGIWSAFTGASPYTVSFDTGSSYYFYYTGIASGAMSSYRDVVVSYTYTPSAVPEIDPATGSSALSLVAGVLAMIEQRRRRAMLVA